MRELEHAIEHAVVLSEGEVILPRSLPARGAARRRTKRGGAGVGHARVVIAGLVLRRAGIGGIGRLGRTRLERLRRSMDELVGTLGLGAMGYPDAKKRLLAEFNDAYVGALLKSTSGNMSEAARRSGLDRSNFRRLVRTTSVDVGAASTRTPPDDDNG